MHDGIINPRGTGEIIRGAVDVFYEPFATQRIAFSYCKWFASPLGPRELNANSM